jgi:nitrous oxidase accessory protein NosD
MTAGGSRRAMLASIAAVTTALWIVGGATAASAHDGHNWQDALYVSPDASSSASGWSCDTATFTSINAAVVAAPAWSTVVVCPGTYAEDVIISKPLTLVGRQATIDATGLENAVQVVSSDVTVRRLTLENAYGEGLLAGIDSLADIGMLPPGPPVLSDISVDEVQAINNDKGFNGTEQSKCKYPGDCGGGIHFNVVTSSEITDSHVVGNADGILLTDDYGPNSDNVVSDNYVADNTHECGIVLPSHNPGAVSFNPTTMVVTGRNPEVGGVFDNVVTDNVVLRNGTDKAPPQFGGGGSGAGIGIFGSGPGTGAYDNVVRDNYISGSGMAGFTIHAHLPGGEDVNGNKVVDNDFGTNNVGGDGFDGPPGPTNFATTAIAVYSAPTVEMTIRGNHIRDNAIGIWLSTTVTAHGLPTNHFHNVPTHVVTG